jgi:tetratricopeptide (TPR) repeat protein
MKPLVRALVSVVFLASLAAPLDAADFERLFRDRRWGELDKAFAVSSPDMAPRDLSLVANAFWVRGNWKDAVACMDRAKKGMPAEIAPYADMIRILGLERTERTEEARVEAARLLASKRPKDLEYFVAYAMYRLTDPKDTASRRAMLRKMHASADGKAQKMQALSELIALGDAKDAARRAETANACLELLSLHPTNARALAILSESPKPWPPDVSFVTGYAAYLGKDYSKAAALLRTVPIASKNGRMARYYRGFSLMRLGRGAEALDVFGPLALSGKGYADSAVRRIALLSKGTLKEPGVALLRKVVATRRGDMAARAMEALSRLLSGAEARTMEDRVVREYPDSEHAAGILWERGWKRWDAGAVADALAVWKKLLLGSARPVLGRARIRTARKERPRNRVLQQARTLLPAVHSRIPRVPERRQTHRRRRAERAGERARRAGTLGLRAVRKTSAAGPGRREGFLSRRVALAVERRRTGSVLGGCAHLAASHRRGRDLPQGAANALSPGVRGCRPYDGVAFPCGRMPGMGDHAAGERL